MDHPNICAIKAYFYSQGENKVNNPRNNFICSCY